MLYSDIYCTRTCAVLQWHMLYSNLCCILMTYAVVRHMLYCNTCRTRIFAVLKHTSEKYILHLRSISYSCALYSNICCTRTFAVLKHSCTRTSDKYILQLYAVLGHLSCFANHCRVPPSDSSSVGNKIFQLLPVTRTDSRNSVVHWLGLKRCTAFE